MSSEVKVLVVCLGNICRSPMGEAVLASVAKTRNLDVIVDSCGTAGYHVGDEPDDRTVAVCKKHNVPIVHQARQIKVEDFERFTHILASDQSNLADLKRVQARSKGKAELRLWGSYLEGDKPIPDPYYGGLSGFERVYEQCLALSHAFLDDIFDKPE
ncbi:phosphotyrosine protein phosphatase [Mycena floridula]|nr:phosphotyrosine protein phosphatase [Mycena floridula]